MPYREPQGEARWRAVDFSEMRIRQAQHQYVPSWRGAFLWCLRWLDIESAELIRQRNQGDSDEQTD